MNFIFIFCDKGKENDSSYVMNEYFSGKIRCWGHDKMQLRKFEIMDVCYIHIRIVFICF